MNGKSVLSISSLGGYEKKKPAPLFFSKHGVKVQKLGANRKDRSKRYPVCVLAPIQGWYPSKMANFVFADKEFDPLFLQTFAADEDWNPSVWLHAKSQRYVVRVPKNMKKNVWKRLYARGMWYDPALNTWNKRGKRSKKRGFPNYIDARKMQKKLQIRDRLKAGE